MMFLFFALRRYARFISYLAAFLAGLSMMLSIRDGLCLLALSLLLGSFAAYSRKDMREA